jgi:hypothetical protein
MRFLKVPPIVWERVPLAKRWQATDPHAQWAAQIIEYNAHYTWKFSGESRTYCLTMTSTMAPRTLALATAQVRRARDRWIRMRRAEVGPRFGLPPKQIDDPAPGAPRGT